MQYKRILLKLSGEVLAGTQHKGITPSAIKHYAQEIKKAYEKGIEIIIVIGGGNLHRGNENHLNLNRIESDQMGMLATIMNAIALSAKLRTLHIPTQLMTRVAIPHIATTYHRQEALRAIAKKRVLIIGGGLGIPLLTTDSAGIMTAIELNANVMIKGTNVDKVYSQDPKKNAQAKAYDKIAVQDAIESKLKVIDTTALLLSQAHQMPILLYNAKKNNALQNLLKDHNTGTLIHP